MINNLLEQIQNIAKDNKSLKKRLAFKVSEIVRKENSLIQPLLELDEVDAATRSLLQAEQMLWQKYPITFWHRGQCEELDQFPEAQILHFYLQRRGDAA